MKNAEVFGTVCKYSIKTNLDCLNKIQKFYNSVKCISAKLNNTSIVELKVLSEVQFSLTKIQNLFLIICRISDLSRVLISQLQKEVFHTTSYEKKIKLKNIFD